MDNVQKACLHEMATAVLLKNWKNTKHEPITAIVLDYLKQEKIDPRKIKDVHWCGDVNALDRIIGEDARGNPSDVVIEFKDGTFFGISLKQTTRTFPITYKNIGLSTVSSYLGHDYVSIVKEYEERIVDQLSLPINHTERKEYIKNNPKIKYIVDMQGHIMMQILLRNPEWGLKVLYEQKPHKENVDHLLDTWMNIKDPVIPYVIVTDRLGDHTLFDPMKSKRREKLMKSRKLIWGINGTSLTVDLKDLNIMAMRIKFTSVKFASSVKFSGVYT